MARTKKDQPRGETTFAYYHTQLHQHRRPVISRQACFAAVTTPHNIHFLPLRRLLPLLMYQSEHGTPGFTLDVGQADNFPQRRPVLTDPKQGKIHSSADVLAQYFSKGHITFMLSKSISSTLIHVLVFHITSVVVHIRSTATTLTESPQHNPVKHSSSAIVCRFLLQRPPFFSSNPSLESQQPGAYSAYISDSRS